MAEFQEVMRQWERMCRARTLCNDGCPIRKADIGCNVAGAWDASKEIESLVMKWAEEHSEPVYPTWGEWLEGQDITRYEYRETNGYQKIIAYPLIALPKYNQPIPAETAEKLGIPPIEVTK